MFFLLSGFIITLRLLEERENTGNIDLQAFYVRRAFRILPPALLYLACLCAIAQIRTISDFSWSGVAGALFFFRNYQTWYGNFGIYTAHFWSLAIEEHFYLLWPGLLALAAKRTAFSIAVVAAVACSAWRHYDIATAASFHWAWIHPHGTMFPVRTDVRLDGMLLGAALAIAFSNPSFRSRVAGLHRSLPLCFLTLALVVTRLNLLQPSLLANVFIGVAMCFSAFQTTKGVLHKVLNSSFLLWLGRISYGLYIWQQLFLLHPADGSHPMGLLNRAPWNLLAALAMAELSYRLLDRKLVPLSRQWHARRPTSRAQEAVLYTQR